MNVTINHRFSILELVVAIGLASLLMVMGVSLITTTRNTHIRAQQYTQSIRVLDNVIQRLSAYPELTVETTRLCLEDEFSKASPLRKHELEAVAITRRDNVLLVIRHIKTKRQLAQVEVSYDD